MGVVCHAKRIDSPGALHHIIVCGIEWPRIFSDGQGRDNFVEQLGNIITETQSFCFAWAPMPKIYIKRAKLPLPQS